GHGDAAVAGYETAREIVRRLVDERPQDSKALRLAADIDSEMVHYFFDQRNPSRVLQASQGAENMVRRIVALNPSSVEAREYLSVAQSNLGEAYLATRELDLAANSFRAAAETREQLVRDEPEVVGHRRDLMVAYGHLGDTLGPPRGGGLGDLHGAEQALRKATDIAEWLCRRDPADRKARFDLASAKYRTGATLMLQAGRAP